MIFPQNRHNKKSAWSREELIFIRDNSKTMTINKMAEHLKRSSVQVKNKCQRQGLSIKTKE